jgi:molybdate transport system substrate-binding protein
VRRAAAAGVILLLAGCSAVAGEAGDAGEPGGTVTVFAAASLTGAFDEIAAAFEREHPGVDVVLSFGGSATLATQVVDGAPADVLAAASPEAMTTLLEAGFVVDPADFATNSLEIAVPSGNPGSIAGIADLADPGRTIALCAVEVPCGAAAQRVFDSLGLTPAPDTLEQDVKAVLTKVELGEVDAGLVYRTDVLAAHGTVEGIAFAQAADAVNRYPIAALTPGGEAFVAWVLSDAGLALLREAGFGAP